MISFQAKFLALTNRLD